MQHTAPHTAAHCSTLQYAATHNNALHRNATHCSTLHQLSHELYICTAGRLAVYSGNTATRCSTLQHTATHCNTLQHAKCHKLNPNSITNSIFAVLGGLWYFLETLQHTATHCDTLQHTATFEISQTKSRTLSRTLYLQRWAACSIFWKCCNALQRTVAY